jgi:hypothetical protein
MKHGSSIVLLLVACAMFAAHSVSAVCTLGRPYPENVCLFNAYTGKNGTDYFLGSDNDNFARACGQANQNPFLLSINGINADQASCESAIKADGNDCLNAFSAYTCSARCVPCPFFYPCPRFCDAVTSNCPTADAAGCFSTLKCNSIIYGCTEWNANIAKINDGTAVTTVPTTTTAPTSDGSTLSTRDSLAMLAVILAVALVAF